VCVHGLGREIFASCYPLVTGLTVVTVLSCFDIGIAADVPPTSEVHALATLLQIVGITK